MTPTLLAEFYFVGHADGSSMAAEQVAGCLTRPALSGLSRLSYRRKKTRRGYQAATATAIESYLTDPKNDDVFLDNGPQEPISAYAMVSTGQAQRTWGPTSFMLNSFVLLPHDPDLTATQIETFCSLALALGVVAGCVTVEPSFELAHRYVSGATPKLRPGLSAQHLTERQSHNTADRLKLNVSGPEWGLFLSQDHFARLPLAVLEQTKSFSTVQRLSDKLAFVTLTPDPLDAIRPDFKDHLSPARKTLTPLYETL
jgi:hypothetical protein